MLLFFLAQSVVSESALTHYEYCMPREIRTPDATRVFLSCTAYPPAVDMRVSRASVAPSASRTLPPVQSALHSRQTPPSPRPQAVALFLKRVTNASYFALITI